MSNENQNINEGIISENPYEPNSRNKSESDIQSSKSSKESSKSKIIELNLIENLDIPKIKELNTKCIEFFFEDKSELALEILKKLEIFLESNVLEPKFNYDSKLILLIMHNIACCYQTLKDYENCILYLDSVIYHFENELEDKFKIKINEDFILQNIFKDSSNNSLLGDLILELRFSAKYHLQMCAVLSQAKKHMTALKHAKLALLLCEDNIIKTYFLFLQMNSKNIDVLDNNDSEKTEKSENNENKSTEKEEKMKLMKKIINDLYNKIKNFRSGSDINNNENKAKNKNNFDSYLKYRKSEIHDYHKNLALLNNIRKLFRTEINKEDWLSNVNIGNIMYLSPLNDGELDLETEPKYEILGDAILEKVIFLSVSYFCVSMEMYQLAMDKNNKKINGEFFLKQACDLSDIYLPVSCPLTKHYINSYYKYYEKDLDIIPEGKVVDYKINLIRNEIEINKDTQSFIRMQKINYTNNINNNEGIPKINISNIINKKETNEVNLSNITNNNISKKSKILTGLKLNLENILNNKNNSSRENGPKNIKLNSFKENKNLDNNSNSKRNNNNNLENTQINNNFEIYPNKNNLNVAEKSKIKDFPKFKLNFNKINVLNKSGEEKKNLSNNTNNTAKNKIKKINMKISIHGKTNRDSSSKNKSKIDKINIKKGFKLESLKSNIKHMYINEALRTTRKEKNSGIKYAKLNISKTNNLDKHISKTSRQKKSPLGNTKGIVKNNLFEKIIKNKTKPVKKQKEKSIKKISNKKNFGYLTQREVTNFRLKEGIRLNSDIHLKNKNNSLNNKKNHMKQMSSFNEGHKNKYKKVLNNYKVKNIATANTSSHTLQVNKIEKPKVKKENEVKNNIKRKKIHLMDKLFNNIFYIEIKPSNNTNANKNAETILECNKYVENSEHINNIAQLIKIKNPFKI
jgi:hypothetical protein